MTRFNYLGPAEMLRLDTACAPIRDAFDAYPYLVGSVLDRADYRDVDVRLILDDDHFDDMFGDVAHHPRAKMRLLLINSAISDWLAKASGLPVDFQFQPVSECREYDGRPRNALAMHDSAIRYDVADSTTPPPSPEGEGAARLCRRCGNALSRHHPQCPAALDGGQPDTPAQPRSGEEAR